jgi:alpha-D-xyloside xylohydrolase
MKKLSYLLPLFLFLSLMFSCSEADKTPQLNWEETANGVWKSVVGEKTSIDLLSAAGAKPFTKALNKKEKVEFPLNPDKIKVTKFDGKLYLRFPLTDDEKLYGLGLQFKSIKRRGRVYHLHVDHYGGKDNGRTHAPVPFYVSSKGYGVLINSARYITVYAGTTVRADSPSQPEIRDRNTDANWTASPKSDAVEILVPTTSAEVYVFGGTSILDVVSRYNLFSGGGVLPPKWGLGFTYRTNTKFNNKQVVDLVDEFEKQKFPLDFLGLEPGWQGASYPCSYAWSSKRFPKGGTVVRKLLSKKVRTNLWVNPYLAPSSPIFKKMKPLSGSHNVWCGIVPDYSTSEARKVFSDYYKNTLLKDGVSGLKMDENDGFDGWLWPDVASFPSGNTGEQIRQTYGLLMQKMILDIYKEKNERTYGLVRASNAGAAPLPFVIYNDYYSHPDFITALINSGFCGVLWTPEARSSKTGEEWLRRIQSVCFSPMAMINAWASGTLPWSYPEVNKAVNDIAMLRMQMLPYNYSTFAQYHFEGFPPIRPMVMVDGFIPDEKIVKGKLDGTKNPYEIAIQKEIKDQYMFGDNLLVAPMFTGQKSRKVILPAGKWFDFYTGDLVGENEIITVTPGLAKIPLFVRDGGIIPLTAPRLHAPRSNEKIPLEIRVYGNAKGTFVLYDDDGETFDYEKGKCSFTELSFNGEKGTVKRLDDGVFNYNEINWIYKTK